MTQYDFPTPPVPPVESKEDVLSPQVRSYAPPIDVPPTRSGSTRVLWGTIGFVVGIIVGGLIASLIINLIILLFSTAIGQNLSYTDTGILIKLLMLSIGIVLGAIIGCIIAISDPIQPPIATYGLTTMEQQDAAMRAQEIVRRAQVDSLSYNFLRSVRYTAFLFVDTLRLLLPSTVVSTRRSDDTYISDMTNAYKDILGLVNLDAAEREIILRNWLPQIEWTNNRANRERDVYEIISWWQILFAALIPFIAGYELIFGIRSTIVVGILGIFVTITTGILQFRRPENNWVQYRLVTENYQRELWNYISLAGSYSGKKHKASFNEFINKMTAIREEDIRNFFRQKKPNVLIQTSTPTDNQMETISKIDDAVQSSISVGEPEQEVLTSSLNIPVNADSIISPDNG
jgi:hypothetical protein